MMLQANKKLGGTVRAAYASSIKDAFLTHYGGDICKDDGVSISSKKATALTDGTIMMFLIQLLDKHEVFMHKARVH